MARPRGGPSSWTWLHTLRRALVRPGRDRLSGRVEVDEIFVVRRSGERAHEVMPRVHRIASRLKRWWLGTGQGAIRPLHLDYDLDEFTFRLNRRTSRKRGKLFYRLIQQAVEVDPVAWTDVAEGSSRSRPQP